MKISQPRRAWLKALSGAAILSPLGLLSGRASAAKNAALRQTLQYQDSPKDGKQCSKCIQFVPGKTPKDPGGCTAIGGDTEISPTGWCMAWVEKK